MLEETEGTFARCQPTLRFRIHVPLVAPRSPEQESHEQAASVRIQGKMRASVPASAWAGVKGLAGGVTRGAQAIRRHVDAHHGGESRERSRTLSAARVIGGNERSSLLAPVNIVSYVFILVSVLLLLSDREHLRDALEKRDVLRNREDVISRTMDAERARTQEKLDLWIARSGHSVHANLSTGVAEPGHGAVWHARVKGAVHASHLLGGNSSKGGTSVHMSYAAHKQSGEGGEAQGLGWRTRPIQVLTADVLRDKKVDNDGGGRALGPA
ncbi:hypothetical protein T484DRAFT_1764043 [Baffinella frigidus]|nr:hypothetical protein T484DRAFT_1764043 [Cryptophyta sp. CCMP2293]